jgi:hypothetical protein
MWTLGAEVWADPFTYLALTPTGLGVKMGQIASKVPGGTLALKAATFPWRAPISIARTVFGPRSGGPLAAFNLARQPEDVLTGTQRVIYEDMKIGSDKWLGATHDAWASGKGLFDKRLKLKSASDKKIGAALWGKRVDLNPEEKAIADDLRDFVNTHLDELAKTRPEVLKELGLSETNPLQMNLFGPKRSLTLDTLFPSMVERKSIPIDIWQSWSVENLGRVFLGLSKEQALAKGLKINLADAPLDRFSAIESVRDLMFVIKKKQYLEPELLRHAPRKGRAGESLAISSASRWQRRYVTDLINSFTGNQRGRKQIEFDYSVAEFWEKIASNPAGKRVDSLFRKLGYGMTRDGMPDVSPTTKIAGLWSGTIIQNVLGLRLKSAVLNSAQTLNFAVSRGLPATIKGMVRLADPTFRPLRKEANLKGDYRALFDEETWLRGFGKTWSEVLMGPFNLMENLIRGTGFHVGIDQWMRINAKGRSLKQVLANSVDRESLVRFAHFESSNGAFVYGTLGRPPALAGNPALRPFTTLLSFPFKQAEFLRREFVRDGTSLVRFIGLHGWLIERSNQWGGVASEDFLGWGFKPMTRSFGGIPIITSPPASLLLHSIEALAAVADKDYTLASRKWNQAKAELPIVLSPVPIPWLAMREMFGDPMTAKKGLYDEWVTKRKEIGETFVDISRPDVIKNLLIGRTTTQKVRSDLETRVRVAKKQVDFELDKRVSKVAKSLLGTSGDDLGEAIGEFVRPVVIEGKPVYPLPEMLESRLTDRVEKGILSRDILAMKDSGFLGQLFLLAQIDLLSRVNKEVGR